PSAAGSRSGGVELAHLAALQRVHRGQVVDVLDDELQVVLLGGVAQVFRAAPSKERVVGRLPPALGCLGGEAVADAVPRLDQHARDARGAQATLVAELPATVGAED